jgi:hypothetical protein
MIFLTACTEKSTETSGKPIETENKTEAALKLAENNFAASGWKADNSHHKTVIGTLTVNGKAVVKAMLQISDKRKMETNEKGEFTLMVDTNMIEKAIIRVISLDEATIDGEKVDGKTKEELLTQKETLTVYHPISVDKVETNIENSSLVNVYVKAETGKDDQFPKFGVEKFSIAGSIKDSSGNAVEGATVNIRRDGVEGFSMSNPSDKEGKFALYYIPEDDENHIFYVHLPSKDVTYTLPQGKTFLFPGDHGVNIDITLPKEGTIIDDKPPTLVTTTAPGALFKGILIGVNVDENVAYSVSVPKRDGTFMVTLPKTEWEKSPTFFETLYRGFHLEEIKPGDVLLSDNIPAPKPFEPSEIVATQ